MDTTAEKVAYLKGLIDATNFASEDTKKIFSALADVLESISEDLSINAENIDNVDNHLLEVDEDLGFIEEIIYSEEEDYEEASARLDSSDEDYDYDDEDYDYDEDEYDYDEDDEEEDFDELEDSEEEEMYEVQCPACNETIYLQESVILDGAVDCPNCGEPLEFDIEFED